MKPGDILVGKITPKGETQLSPRGEAPPRHLRREGRRRPRQLAPGSAGRRGHRHQRPRLLPQGHGEGRARQGHRGSGARAPREDARRGDQDPPRLVLPPDQEAARQADDDGQARRRQGQGPPPEGRRCSTTRSSTEIPRKYWPDLPVEGAEEITQKVRELEEIVTAPRGALPRQDRSPLEGRRAAAGRHQDGEGLHRHQAQAPGRRQDGRAPRQQGRHLPHPARRGHAVPRRTARRSTSCSTRSACRAA